MYKLRNTNEVHLNLPKFKFEYSQNLNEILNEMRMKKEFIKLFLFLFKKCIIL